MNADVPQEAEEALRLHLGNPEDSVTVESVLSRIAPAIRRQERQRVREAIRGAVFDDLVDWLDIERAFDSLEDPDS